MCCETHRKKTGVSHFAVGMLCIQVSSESLKSVLSFLFFCFPVCLPLSSSGAMVLKQSLVFSRLKCSASPIHGLALKGFP